MTAQVQQETNGISRREIFKLLVSSELFFVNVVMVELDCILFNSRGVMCPIKSLRIYLGNCFFPFILYPRFLRTMISEKKQVREPNTVSKTKYISILKAHWLFLFYTVSIIVEEGPLHQLTPSYTWIRSLFEHC